MKKFFLMFVVAIMAFNASAVEYKEGINYETLKKSASEEPRIVEFFSFYCGACYQFDQNYRISDKLKAIVPKDGSYAKYHVSFMGGETGVMLTQAWGIAMTLKVEEEVKPLMFEAVQKDRNIRSLNDIRAIFVKAGVKVEEFDNLWDSFVIKSLLVKQQKEAEGYGLKGVPSIYVNGKYQTMNQNMKSVEEIVDVVKFLLTKK